MNFHEREDWRMYEGVSTLSMVLNDSNSFILALGFQDTRADEESEFIASVSD